jgi:hypothetical protein
MLYGGVVIAQPKSDTGSNSYGKAVSFGRYHKRSAFGLRVAARVLRDSRFVRQTAIRTQGNPYMRTARDQTRPVVVKLWQYNISRWIESNGFETTGMGT